MFHAIIGACLSKEYRMSDDRPNIVLIMTDQHRGDCIGFDDHPVLQTPYLDSMAQQGFIFVTVIARIRNAYRVDARS